MAQAMPQEQDEPVERERVKRPLTPDLSEAAETLGIMANELEAVMPESPHRGRRE